MNSEKEQEKVASSRCLEATHMLDGKFYNHLKQQLAPVFGDPNQIRLLQHYNNLKEELNRGVWLDILIVELEDDNGESITEEQFVAFDCFCGRQMSQKVWHKPPRIIQRKRKLQCDCKAEYELRALIQSEVTAREFKEVLLVKLISHEK